MASGKELKEAARRLYLETHHAGRGERAMNSAYNANYDEIKRNYGKKRADNANLGWGSTDNEIVSKVYGKDRTIVTTHLDPKRGYRVTGHDHD